MFDHEHRSREKALRRVVVRHGSQEGATPYRDAAESWVRIERRWSPAGWPVLVANLVYLLLLVSSLAGTNGALTALSGLLVILGGLEIVRRLVNRSFVAIDQRHLRVGCRPLSWHRERIWALESLRDVFCEERSLGGRTFEVCARLSDGRTIELMGGLQSMTEATFISECIRGHLAWTAARDG
jgi:hypothetical protein